MAAERRLQALDSYPLLAAILGLRSRRFAKGMRLGSAPLAYASVLPSP